MRVAFDGRVIADRYPGIGRYAFELARALSEYVDLALLVDPRAPNTRFDLGAVRAAHVPVRAGPASLAAQWRVPAALASIRPAVYHSPYFLMPYALRVTHYALRFTFHALRASQPTRDAPTIATFFDLTPLLPEAGYHAPARLAVRLAHGLAARSAARLIVLSRWVKEAIAHALDVPPDKIEVIPPGVDPSFTPRPSAEIEAARARLGLPPQYLLYVGAHRPHKNLERLLQAYARLPSDAPPLVLAGPVDPRYPKAQVAAEAAGLGRRAVFLGPVAESDLPALYSGAALFVQPSLAEGFGLPVLEAQACGAPVLCSSAPGLDEAAGAAPRFDPTNSAAMAAAMAELLEDGPRRCALRAAGLEHARSFTWARAAEATLAAYAREAHA